LFLLPRTFGAKTAIQIVCLCLMFSFIAGIIL
jgi:hypothetical protein